jgi:hypothetical protein
MEDTARTLNFDAEADDNHDHHDKDETVRKATEEEVVVAQSKTIDNAPPEQEEHQPKRQKITGRDDKIRSPYIGKTTNIKRWKKRHFDPTKGISPHDVEEMELLQSKLWKPYRCVATNRKKNETMDEEDEWNSMFHELQQYYIKYGHTAVPPTYPENPRLALWTQKQRHTYREVTTLFRRPTSRVEKQKIVKLRSLNFVCDVKAFAWDVRYEQLKKKLHDHRLSKIDVTTARGTAEDVAEFLNLSNDMKGWIQTQICCLQNPHLILSKEQQHRLRQIFIIDDENTTY